MQKGGEEPIRHQDVSCGNWQARCSVRALWATPLAACSEHSWPGMRERTRSWKLLRTRSYTLLLLAVTCGGRLVNINSRRGLRGKCSLL